MIQSMSLLHCSKGRVTESQIFTCQCEITSQSISAKFKAHLYTQPLFHVTMTSHVTRRTAAASKMHFFVPNIAAGGACLQTFFVVVHVKQASVDYQTVHAMPQKENATQTYVDLAVHVRIHRMLQQEMDNVVEMTT